LATRPRREKFPALVRATRQAHLVEELAHLVEELAHLVEELAHLVAQERRHSVETRDYLARPWRAHSPAVAAAVVPRGVVERMQISQ
jgi:hypothetical protein